MGNVLGGVQMSDKVVRLKDKSDVLTACHSSLGVAGGAHVLAQYFQLTFRGLIEQPDDGEERRFSASGGAGNGHRFAFMNAEGCVFKRPGGGREETCNIMALDIRFCGGSARGEGTFCLVMRHFSAPSASRRYLP